MGLQRFDKAAETLMALVDKNPDYEQAYFALGEASDRQGKQADSHYYLGIYYQKTGNPVAITCTSGSAILNYAPAVSEAYYQSIPLVILSADRPAFWIDKGEGQTIRQRKALSNFIHAELNIETDDKILDYASLDQKICECIDLSMHPIPGPVHINIEYEEPL